MALSGGCFTSSPAPFCRLFIMVVKVVKSIRNTKLARAVFTPLALFIRKLWKLHLQGITTRGCHHFMITGGPTTPVKEGAAALV